MAPSKRFGEGKGARSPKGEHGVWGRQEPRSPKGEHRTVGAARRFELRSQLLPPNPSLSVNNHAVRRLRRDFVAGFAARSFMTNRNALTVVFVSGKARATSSGNTRTFPDAFDHQRKSSARPFAPRRAAYGFGRPCLKS